MNEEKNMIGDTDYELKHAIHIGGKEVVFGEDINAENGLIYYVGCCEKNELFGRYEGCVGDYLEMLSEFTKRIETQIEVVKAEIAKVTVPMDVITVEQCYQHDYSQDINGKVVAIKAETFWPEYRRADQQLMLVTGGNGALGNARGSAVFCVNLYSGEHTRFERRNVLGEIKELPDWAKERLEAIQAERSKPPKSKEMGR